MCITRYVPLCNHFPPLDPVWVCPRVDFGPMPKQRKKSSKEKLYPVLPETEGKSSDKIYPELSGTVTRSRGRILSETDSQDSIDSSTEGAWEVTDEIKCPEAEKSFSGALETFKNFPGISKVGCKPNKIY